ncbi:cation diffusion facilitator family transporter [Micromonospora sp. NPDC004704]
MVVAGTANLGIALAKLMAGMVSGSAAMTSEAVHSLADTITEVLLFGAVRRGSRPADERHPFGYGKESYVWAFIAAIFTFVIGAGFSILLGTDTIRHGEHSGNYLSTYIVLVVAFALESVSLTRATRQVRDQARSWKMTSTRCLRHIRQGAVLVDGDAGGGVRPLPRQVARAPGVLRHAACLPGAGLTPVGVVRGSTVRPGRVRRAPHARGAGPLAARPAPMVSRCSPRP